MFITILLTVFGAMAGSFVGAQVWRLRARQLIEEKASGEKVNAKELKRLRPLLERDTLHDRSIDLDTGEQLKWFELIPIISWLALGGKSRYSGKPIGYFELIIEVVMAAAFVLSYIFWPFEITSLIGVIQFVIWLLILVILAIQFVVDMKWYVLWDGLSLTAIGLGAIMALIKILDSSNVSEAIWSVVGSVLILGGLYYMLYVVSREAWVGRGDVTLGVALGLILADWKLALVALFLANLIGSLVVLVGLALRKIKRRQHVPFGPFLITGMVLALFAGQCIVSWYSSAFLG